MRHTDNDVFPADPVFNFNPFCFDTGSSYLKRINSKTNIGNKFFQRTLRAFKYAVFPSKCLACGRLFHPSPHGPSEKTLFKYERHSPIETVFYRVMTPYLCPACKTDFSSIEPPFCIQCGRKFKTASGGNHQCGNCIQTPPSFRTIRSAGLYSGSLKSAIHAFKYKNKVHLSRSLGQLLFFSFMQYYDIRTIDYIIPVPLHASRLKQRGFNQAHLLINQWPTICGGISMDAAVCIDYKNLTRKRRTLSQTGLGRKKRKQNVKGAFAVIDKTKIRGKQVLLIDDVYTTGSTSEECARTLMASGAAGVSVLTLARAD